MARNSSNITQSDGWKAGFSTIMKHCEPLVEFKSKALCLIGNETMAVIKRTSSKHIMTINTTRNIMQRKDIFERKNRV
jgi:hypothetical protein